MSSEKWTFNDSGEEKETNWKVLPNERFLCTLHKISECTINYKKWGLKHAIRLGFIPTEQSLAEHGVEMGENDTAYITTVCNLARSEKSRLWQTLKLMATPEELADVDPNSPAEMQAAYEKLIGREFEVINEAQGPYNNAQAIFRVSQKKKPVESEPTGFEKMPDASQLDQKGADTIDFDEDEIPF